MKYFSLILLTFVIANESLYAGNHQILWSDQFRLTWDDFQGTADKQRRAGVQAATQVSIVLNTRTESNQAHFAVSCYFEKARSWTINRESDYLLAHEQLHFNIAEVFTRKLRQRLQQLKNLNHLNFESRVQQVYRDVNRQHSAFQGRYDRETDHSKNREMQVEWEVKVARLLEETAGFREVNFSVALK